MTGAERSTEPSKGRFESGTSRAGLTPSTGPIPKPSKGRFESGASRALSSSAGGTCPRWSKGRFESGASRATDRRLQSVGALALAVALAVSCSSGPDSSAGDLSADGGPGGNGGSGADGGPGETGSSAVGGFDFAEPAAPPDAAPASADPRTPLGRLRAARLPIWAPELDWAFPPEVCGSAWDLDAVAEPLADDSAVPSFLLDSVPAAAALAVMRYEHLLSEALAAPSALAQLCVAVAAVEPSRSESLSVLASYLETGSRRGQPARHPDEVTVVAVAPTSVLATACVEPGYPAVVSADGETRSEPRAPARLQSYLLRVARGLEDDVTDVSLRVSATYHRPAEDCAGLAAWTGEWRSRAEQWAAEGRLWELVDSTITADDLCAAPTPENAPESVRECPADWP